METTTQELSDDSSEISDSLPRSILEGYRSIIIPLPPIAFVTSPRNSRRNNADVQAWLARHSLRHPMGKRGTIEATASKPA